LKSRSVSKDREIWPSEGYGSGIGRDKDQSPIKYLISGPIGWLATAWAFRSYGAPAREKKH